MDAVNKNGIKGQYSGGRFVPECCWTCRFLIRGTEGSYMGPEEGADCQRGLIRFPTRKGTCASKKEGNPRW